MNQTNTLLNNVILCRFDDEQTFFTLTSNSLFFINKFIFSTPIFKMPFIAYVFMTLSDLLNTS
jgi:hypothetical protein